MRLPGSSPFFLPMKNYPVLIMLIGSLVLAGCARNYVITMNNGRTVTSASKPKLVEGNYVFKDANGAPAYVPAGRVREIAPASMAETKQQQFKSAPGR